MVYPLKVRTNNWSICGLGVEINTPLWIPSQLYQLPRLFWQRVVFKTIWSEKSVSNCSKQTPQPPSWFNQEARTRHWIYLFEEKNWYRTYTKRFKDVKLLLKRYSYITASLLTVVSKKSKYTCQLQRLLKTER